jgi:RHH-type proline utilization regulon transcriptional repressor/proline dehydrogenase/delta 1-pyrroline-5-carboxylate dehydrogenase
MRELVIGDPAELATDLGPVIDNDAAEMLHEYVDGLRERVLFRCPLARRHAAGHYFPPTLIELDDVSRLTREIFGPVLHVVRYAAEEVESLLSKLNAIGYGLTLGVQSRVASFARFVEARARVGNIYVNRDMIGAVVGVQPFGGLGLSGTGPKAGGPHYLLRFGAEQTVSVNTAAVGGNVDLLALED